ncbi:MAG: TIGR03557 family F420-dependent LLM class oxidoreductase [Candidatus Binatia bacterium]
MGSPVLGYALSSEEHRPEELVRQAVRAEQMGFSFALISDHFHPWLDTQGQSPFVWSVIGAIAEATQRLELGTGVTCPTIRMHPALVAQAAATCAALMPGRFFLGVGTGENLNEHVVGAGWPAADVRLEMLREAVEIIRRLWQGDEVTHRGPYYEVDRARLYSLPEKSPPLLMAASHREAAKLAGQCADGLISTAPKRALVEQFQDAGGDGICYGQVTVSWAKDEAAARRSARHYWPNAVLSGAQTTELPVPRHFAAAVKDVTEEQVAKQIVCGPDPGPYLEKIRAFVDAGFDHVYLHQVGKDQEGFIRFAAQELIPQCSAAPERGPAPASGARQAEDAAGGQGVV